MTLQDDIKAKKIEVANAQKIINNLQNELRNLMIDEQVANLSKPSMPLPQ